MTDERFSPQSQQSVDASKCPECGDYLEIPNNCLCGWSKFSKGKKTNKTCEYRYDNGDYCEGWRQVYSNSKWLCPKHYQKTCLSQGTQNPEVTRKMIDEIYRVLGVVTPPK